MKFRSTSRTALVLITLLVHASAGGVLAAAPGSWVRADVVSERTGNVYHTREYAAYLALNEQAGVGASVSDGAASGSPWGAAQRYARVFGMHGFALPYPWRGRAKLAVLLHDGDVEGHRHAYAGSQLGVSASRHADAWRLRATVDLTRFEQQLDGTREGDMWALRALFVRHFAQGRYLAGGTLQVEHYLPPSAASDDRRPATVTLLGMRFQMSRRPWTVGATVQASIGRQNASDLEAVSDQRASLRVSYLFDD